MLTNTPSPQFLKGAPYFPVGDVERSISFYEGVLGFTCAYRGGAPAHFAIVSRDGLAVMLHRVADPTAITPSEAQGGTWDVFFWVANADALYAELLAKGAEVVYAPLVQEEYHMKEFAIRDCDGHVLGFGEELAG